MKLLGLCLLLLLAGACHAYPAEDKSLSLEDTDLDNEQGESVKESQIAKRSGSFDYVAHLKSGLLSSIGQASASIASGSSGGSSGGDSYKSHEVHVHGNSVEYDPWSFKKSVLNTIFQAVKAITGGVTALKGQLIKGSGYALSAGGNLVAAGGDKVTDVAITTYEIPTGHSNYGPPSKPPTYSSATHQYLPPAGSNYGGGGGGGGAPFSLNHAAFEAPQSNYLPSPYGQDAIRDDFSNNYGRHTKLSDDEARRAALQLQEILSMLPNGKTEYTASKTVALDTSNAPPTGSNVEQADLYNSYGVPLPHNLGTLESLSHTESITAAYAPPSQGAADIYHQMAKKPQTPEEAYIQKHPNEGYDYQPHPASGPAAPPAPTNEYRVENYHASKSNALKDLSPIIAALEVAKRKGPGSSNGPVTYAIEKQVHKTTPFQYLPPVVQKTKYVYSAPPPRNSYSGGYKVRRHVGAKRTSSTHSRAQDYEIQDPLMFNRLLYV
ncbi:uncharacterized protein LOC116805418 isoform X2 [Drosophila grimshawi]|uniref:uncharacterized protein LOC116805418 isoform X2 n=1 Tax=Drosophila grimshawi TaxID=7222 RepID=UPI000C86F2FA|nr:uncharacterized protein LOC116805418 isoform X2 [Drosophila grimshawi]